MTIQRKTEIFCVLTFALFLFMVGFHTGRLTNSTVTLRSTCSMDEETREDLKAGWYLSEASK